MMILANDSCMSLPCWSYYFNTMKTLPFFLVLLLPGAISAQEADSLRKSIHQIEAEQHRWDVLRTDRAVPSLKRGKELAQEGRFAEAEAEFRRALKTRKTIANFNLGVLFFEQGQYELALKYLDVARKAKRDSVVLEYYFNAKRLARGIPVR
jgi:Flp pilus assembly protein TadD